MSRVRQIVITMTAGMTWTQFWMVESMWHLGFQSLCHMGPNIQTLRLGDLCGHFDTYLIHRAHTGQTLEHFEVFHFCKSENKGKLTVRFYGSADTPHIDPNNFKQEALDVGVQQSHRCVHRSLNSHRCVHSTHNPHGLHEFTNYWDLLCFFSSVLLKNEHWLN